MARRRLTGQQKARIVKIQQARRQRVTERAEAALDHAGHVEQTGRVVTRHGQNLVVADAKHGLWHCLFRANVDDIVCGDRVVWQTTGDGEGVVTAMLPRQSALSRPDHAGRQRALAANLTQLVIVVAPRPEPSGYLIDQYLIVTELMGIDALITLNKSDLLDPDGLKSFTRQLSPYLDIGYSLITVSAKQAHGLDPLQERLRGHTSILVGQSGVGKSSLTNALIPDQDVQVGRLSRATGLGRHTTSTATLYRLPSGGELIDSPGVRSFRLGKINRQQLEQGFRELRPFTGACGFRNCAHEAEPDCAVLQAVADGIIHPARLETFHRLSRNLPSDC